MKVMDLQRKMGDMKLFSPLQMKMLLGNYVPKTVSEWTKKNYIQKIRNNLYVKTEERHTRDERDLFLFANHIYTPSYISLQTAFAFHGLIPEGVYTTLSCTTRKTKRFDTSFGPFHYRSIKKELFFGYNIIKINKISFRMADLEKSILDYLYLENIPNDIESFASMRWHKDVLKKIKPRILKLYLEPFNSRQLEKKITTLKQYYG